MSAPIASNILHLTTASSNPKKTAQQSQSTQAFFQECNLDDDQYAYPQVAYDNDGWDFCVHCDGYYGHDGTPTARTQKTSPSSRRTCPNNSSRSTLALNPSRVPLRKPRSSTYWPNGASATWRASHFAISGTRAASKVTEKGTATARARARAKGSRPAGRRASSRAAHWEAALLPEEKERAAPGVATHSAPTASGCFATVARETSTSLPAAPSEAPPRGTWWHHWPQQSPALCRPWSRGKPRRSA